jgi:hypothetical protein
MTRSIAMTPKKIVISPLNWGFGHAGRMIPLALELRKRGHEIIFCADSAVIPMLSRELPGINITETGGLHIRYFRKLPQWISVLLHLPHIMAVSVREHSTLKRLAAEHNPDIIISDNRFGFRHKRIFSVYVTHMIRIPFPSPFRFMEPLGIWLHRKVIERFDLCLIPDFPGELNLSGRLSHGVRLPRNTVWTGPMSRFNSLAGTGQLTEDDVSAEIHTLAGPGNSGGTGTLPGSDSPAALTHTPVIDAPAPVFTIPDPYRCLILSGPEPQRSVLMKTVAAAATDMHLVILEGTGEHNAIARNGKVTFVSNPDTAMMKAVITGSEAVISRSGYTTLMELVSLQKGAVIIPTPGQPEQEYLGEYFDKKWGFKTLKQDDVSWIKGLESLQNQTYAPVFLKPLPPDPFFPKTVLQNPGFPDSEFSGSSLSLTGLNSSGLLDAAIARLTEQKIE